MKTLLAAKFWVLQALNQVKVLKKDIETKAWNYKEEMRILIFFKKEAIFVRQKISICKISKGK